MIISPGSLNLMNEKTNIANNPNNFNKEDELQMFIDSETLSFNAMLERANDIFYKDKNYLKAEVYYRYCLKKYAYDEKNLHLTVQVLNKLAYLCNNSKRFEEAIEYKKAEKMILEQVVINMSGKGKEQDYPTIIPEDLNEVKDVMSLINLSKQYQTLSEIMIDEKKMN